MTGKWSPWYVDDDPNDTGTENLTGPETLDGEYKIVSAKAPATAGSVSIKPLKIVGASDDSLPYQLTWTIGTFKLYGIGIRTG